MDYLFFAKSKKTFFGVFLGIILKTSDSVSFLPLRHPNFMRSFREILWSVLKKNAFTYWHTDSDEIIGPLFA